MTVVPLAVAELALELRTTLRRTRSGRRRMPWSQIALEVQRRGLGTFRSADIADAVLALPVDKHPDAPMGARARAALEQTWRDGWARDFPGEPWPGLEAARRRLQERR